MTVPDKIYTNNRGGYAELPIFSQADANIEYIRKEALIDWTNKMLQDTANCLDLHGNQAFMELYHKLNSM